MALGRPMAEFTLFSLYIQKKLENSVDQKWITQGEPNYNQDFFGNMDYNDLLQFVDYYMAWLKEMKENDRSFEPFNLNVTNDNVFGFVKNIDTRMVWNSNSNWNLVNDRLNSVDKGKVSKAQTETLGRFIVHINTAVNKLVNEKIKL